MWRIIVIEKLEVANIWKTTFLIFNRKKKTLLAAKKTLKSAQNALCFISYIIAIIWNLLIRF